MKKIIFSILILPLIINVHGICKTVSTTENLIVENKKIDLAGSFPTTGTKSFLPAINVIQYSEYLGITFSNNQGKIIIEIMDEVNNIMSHDIIDTDTKKHYQILLFDYREGNYHIVFTNSQSQYMYGSFVIQE